MRRGRTPAAKHDTGELVAGTTWPAMVKTLASDIPHFRVMALRHVAGFLPFVGRSVDGTPIDVRARLLAGLADPDPLVRQEMPFDLEEAGISGLRAVLGPVGGRAQLFDLSRPRAGRMMRRA